MSNYTIEDYKKAIKAKYEKETDGEYSNNLSSPTSANLRNLCVKRFESNNSRDDLIAFESFFDFPFDKEKKNLFGEDELNKLEAVKRFLLGRTEKPSEDTIQLAAILVDLQPRPFREYKKKFEEDEVKLMDELKRPNFSTNKVLTDNRPVIENNESAIDSGIIIKSEEQESIQGNASESAPKEEIEKRSVTTNFQNIGIKPPFNILRFFAIAAVLFGLGLIIYLVLPKKECIQWSGDHYEEVSCDLKIEGIGTFNSPEPYDERIINLRRIKVCDTTVFFKNEKAIVWYAKVGDSVEFFNTHGNHPENGRALRPVTQYILNKYLKK